MSKRKHRRISRSAALYIPLSVLLIAFFMVFGISVFMKILEIEVAGVSVYSEEEIVMASGIVSGDNLLFIDVDAASQGIRTTKPYISKVVITRVPPSVLRIEVTESTPLAKIVYQDRVLIIDSDCRVLKMTEDMPDGLIEVMGLSHGEPVEGIALKESQGSDIQLNALKEILATIEKQGFEDDVLYLDVSNISKIFLRYAGRITVMLGNPSNARQAVGKLPSVIAQIDAKSSANVTGNLDMSDSSGQWRFIEVYPNE